MSELHLALLLAGPRHGYEVKRTYDDWFSQARPLAYGQVYATLARLERDGLVEVVDTRTEGGPERTVYGITAAGRERLREWLADPAPPAVTGGEDIVRKTVVALRTAHPGVSAREVVARQRTAHLRRVRELQAPGSRAPAAEDVATRLARRHAVLHLDADLRWLDEAVEVLERERSAAPTEPDPPARPPVEPARPAGDAPSPTPLEDRP